MERWDMWDKIMDIQPRSIGELDYIFAEHFHHHYPHINPPIPNKELYIKYQHT
jgi:hypothetical protein